MDILSNRFFRSAFTFIEGLLRFPYHAWRRTEGWHQLCFKLLLFFLLWPIASFLMLLGLLLDLISCQRPLNAEERALAARIFGQGIKLHRVRVTTNSWVLDVLHRFNGARPFVTMYSIHPCRANTLDAVTLVHELTHVWQAQREGPIYIVHALLAQWSAAWRAWFATRCFNDQAAYHFTDLQLEANAGDLSRFNHEQQACIIAAYGAHLLGSGSAISPQRAALLARYAKCVYCA